MKTNVMRLLEREGIAYRVKPHSKSVFTSEEAAEERGVRLSQIVKTMLVATPDGRHVAVLVPGHLRLDTKRAAAALGAKRVAFVPRAEVRKVTGYEPGAVAPLDLRAIDEVLCDPTVCEEEQVDISSGRADAGIELASADLMRVVQPRMAQVALHD